MLCMAWNIQAALAIRSRRVLCPLPVARTCTAAMLSQLMAMWVPSSLGPTSVWRAIRMLAASIWVMLSGSPCVSCSSWAAYAL